MLCYQYSIPDLHYIEAIGLINFAHNIILFQNFDFLAIPSDPGPFTKPNSLFSTVSVQIKASATFRGSFLGSANLLFGLTGLIIKKHGAIGANTLQLIDGHELLWAASMDG